MPNSFFLYNCNFYHSKTALGKEDTLCQLEIDDITQQPQETCQRTCRGPSSVIPNCKDNKL